MFAIPLLCAAVWGISTYLLHLYTGDRHWPLMLAIFYTLVAGLFFFVTFGQGDRELETGTWVLGYDDSAPLYRLVYVLVGAPPLVASIAYLALTRRTQTYAQRYRILLGGASILLYVGMGLIARLAAPDFVIFLTLVPLGALAAVAAVLARYPPATWLRRLESPTDSSHVATPESERKIRRQALAHRLRELI